ncbi:MAG: hypothetical protein V2B18_04010, partial [Pseudomonadota bacterium]
VVYSSPIAVNVYLETGTKVFLCGLTFLGLGSCRVSGQAEVLHSLRHISVSCNPSLTVGKFQSQRGAGFPACEFS